MITAANTLLRIYKFPNMYHESCLNGSISTLFQGLAAIKSADSLCRAAFVSLNMARAICLLKSYWNFANCQNTQKNLQEFCSHLWQLRTTEHFGGLCGNILVPVFHFCHFSSFSPRCSHKSCTSKTEPAKDELQVFHQKDTR